MYPGETAAFVKYFKSKLNPDEPVKKKGAQQTTYCALCGERDKKLETLDKVFKFATFDKPGFCRGRKTGQGLKKKYFLFVKIVMEFCQPVKKKWKEDSSILM